MRTYLNEDVWPDGKGAPSLFSIGVGLGRIPRFCGHTKEWYPVLGHVLTVASILPDEYALYGLLHDAPETCMSDVPTPWKTVAARKREDMLLRRIYQANNVDWPIAQEAQEAVDEADRICLMAEAQVIGHPAADELWPEADETAMEITRLNLGQAMQFMNPNISGPIYETAFEHYNSFLELAKGEQLTLK